VLGASLGAGHDFSGPMAKQQRMAVVTAACLIAVVESQWNWNGESIAVALAIVIIGCLITIGVRLRHLAATLKRRA
jgi:hypothetical protein